MSRSLYLAYGLLAYLAFLLTFNYAIGFVCGAVVPKSVDDGSTGPLWLALAINVGLLGLFAIQHLVMARLWFKKLWTKIVPVPIERSTFVLVTCAILALLFWQWRPLPGIVWNVEAPVLRAVIWSVFALGWLIVLYASMLIDHFDLFGLRQVVLYWKGKPYTDHPFSERSLYRHVRHPLMTGFMIAFWATPTMSYGHLLFAAVTTAFMVVAVRVEERTIAAILGPVYDAYAARTPRFFPRLGRRAPQTETVAA